MELLFGSWPLSVNIGVFVAAAVVITVFGRQLARVADDLADRTGLGEAMMGALLLGATTSLPGIITSVTTAAGGFAELAVSNAVGGIAAQTVFLAVADIAHRKSNLEHAAASMENIMQGVLLIVLLALPIMASGLPSFTLFQVHPATLLMLGLYLYGLRLINHVREEPMWRPYKTAQTQDEAEGVPALPDASDRELWLRLLGAAVVVGIAGWLVGRSGSSLTEQTGLSQTLVGGLFTATVTSLPELVTSVAAVRRGALNLAVSGIIGGNAFDTLFIAASDVAYRDGSIYHAIGGNQLFLLALGILLSGVLLLGLIRREKHGPANIGFESMLILTFYIGSFILLAFLGQ